MALCVLNGAHSIANMWFHVLFLSCFCCGDLSCSDIALMIFLCCLSWNASCRARRLGGVHQWYCATEHLIAHRLPMAIFFIALYVVSYTCAIHGESCPCAPSKARTSSLLHYSWTDFIRRLVATQMTARRTDVSPHCCCMLLHADPSNAVLHLSLSIFVRAFL